MRKIFFVLCLFVFMSISSFAYVVDFNYGEVSDWYVATDGEKSFDPETGVVFLTYLSEGNLNYTFPYVTNTGSGVSADHKVSFDISFTQGDVDDGTILDALNPYLYWENTNSQTISDFVFTPTVVKNGNIYTYIYDLSAPSHVLSGSSYVAYDAAAHGDVSDVIYNFSNSVGSLYFYFGPTIGSFGEGTIIPGSTVLAMGNLKIYQEFEDAATIPEPATFAYAAMGLASIIGLRRKIKK